MSHHQNVVKPFGPGALTLLLFIIGTGLIQAATSASPLSIKSAVYNKTSSSLIVKTRISGAGLLTLLHSKGGVLGQTKKPEEIFTIPLAQLGEIPCQVEARVGELKVSKSVAGAGAECSKVPVCKILKPANNIKTDIKVPTHFEAQFALKDKKAGPLVVEWDFAGGVMSHPFQKQLKGNKPIISGKVSTDATFVRDNSRYHVRFMATDTLGRHCESGIYVDVGQLSTDLPDATALEDMVEASQTNAPAKGSAMNIKAGEKVVLPYQDWTMQTATDARTVPDVVVVYGPQVNNINAVVYEKARKPPVVGPDKVELKYSAAANPADPVGPNSINTTSQNWPLGTNLMQASVQKSDYFEIYPGPDDGYPSYSFTGFLSPELATAIDEGYHNSELFPPINLDHGRFMPGINLPYAVNDPQPFSEYVINDERYPINNYFAARMLPLTDIDDKGRVNPFPLYRIAANETGNDTSIASTDIVANSGRDLHCRECHAKGEIAAKPGAKDILGATAEFFDTESDSLFDQEYAAIKNMLYLHFKVEDEHGPRGCANGAGNCHSTAYSSTALGMPFNTGHNNGGRLSMTMHSSHARLGYNSSKTDVIRTEYGKAEHVIDPYSDLDFGFTPEAVFPVKDAKGETLPMEDNCLKCHGGKREQSYRDRMYTAGVTCYQCHGGMYAVAGLTKSIPGPDGRVYREPWVDEPDCGSCHTGNANLGKGGNADFFSGGVRRLAFDKNDVSATPYQPDRLNSDEVRFAVPISEMTLGNTKMLPDGTMQSLITQAPLYRLGKDNHGQVPCAACHGPAHGIWPNHDTHANDNVTSLQLQGYSGPIAECSVCHTTDSFAKFEDLDEGIRAADPKTGVLGGPHNMHPINDPNWWKSAEGDSDNTDGSTNGGWHNNYAKTPGRLDEDQCAACHGNDHLGTRLSKTPVDREFVNAKGKTIKVKAGTAIGCNLCHKVELSCKGSPSVDCGKSSEKVTQSANRAPVFTSPADSFGVIGEAYHFKVTASDPDGDAVSYQFYSNYFSFDQMQIDAASGAVTAPVLESGYSYPRRQSNHYFMGEYYVSAQDSKGAKSTQLVRIFADCPSGLLWNGLSCDKLTLASQSTIAGLNAGETYLYQVVALQRSGEPLNYSLSGQPAGMTVGENSGLITWVIPDKTSGNFNFTLTVSNKQGDKLEQAIALTICAAPQRWDQNTRSCPGPVKITSRGPANGINTGDTYSYQVTATDDNHLPITYSLIDAPAGMTIDAASGLINWVVQADKSGAAHFTIDARDSQSGFDQQEAGLMVCSPPEHWGYRRCEGPIEFISYPDVWGVDVGQTYHYQAIASHANGLKLTYSLGDYLERGQSFPPRPASMTIDPDTGLISWLAEAQTSEVWGNQVFFSVIATDSNGYVTNQPQNDSITVCTPPTNFDNNFGCRSPVRITSNPPVQGIDVGQTFTYQVIATDTNPDGMPITYSLSDAPANMSINADTGLITWVAEDLTDAGGVAYFTITATDKLGQQEQQFPNLYTCPAPQHWNPDGYCN